MKDYLRQLLHDLPDVAHGGSLVREYLQARLLQMLQDQGAFPGWAFTGGTALRFLYQIPRYSEDLDFSASGKGVPVSVEVVADFVTRAFEREGYQVSAKVKKAGAVKSVTVKFAGLLHELELSPLRSQVLALKLEIDTNPPVGADVTSSLVRRFVLVNVTHLDKASLLAGKLHALLTRPYTKGRDLYDLLWYLSDATWPSPNLEHLNFALAQTGKAAPVTEKNWRGQILERLRQVKWEEARRDVAPFLERPAELSLLTLENFEKLLDA